MIEADLTSVVAIEERTFPSPFSRELFEKYLAHEAIFSWVATEREVVGYAIHSLVEDEADLLNIAVDDKWRKQGVGTLLMEHVLNFVKEKEGRRLFLEVRPSNFGAIDFYKKFGFIQISIRRGYYQDNNEDALLFSKDLA